MQYGPTCRPRGHKKVAKQQDYLMKNKKCKSINRLKKEEYLLDELNKQQELGEINFSLFPAPK